jgi:thiamine kinase-like enzyme
VQPTSLIRIAEQFAVDGKISAIEKFGGGLINDTYRINTHSKKYAQFILQRINSEVFSKPEWVMENLQVLLAHFNKSNNQQAQLTLPEIIKTNSMQLIFRDDSQQAWRAISYIENSQSFEKISQASHAQQVGSALGEFHHRVSDLPVSLLHDTLPGFHITPNYLADFEQTKSAKQESPEIRFCREVIAQHQHQANILETAKQQGLLSVRIIHGDPKLNNLLFSKTTQRAVSIIDLDTVKPGLVHYDIGDCLRSCCQTNNPVQFDFEICKIIPESVTLTSKAESLY